MNTAARDLEKVTANGQQSLTQLLRQTRFVAARLNLEDVERWVDLELNGYAEGAELPGYRKVFTQSLEIYNTGRDDWQFAGNLNFALEARQPIAEIENFSRIDRVEFPVSKNFSIKNDLGDSFGSDWPQRFVVAGSQYKRITEAVMNRWTTELEARGIKVFDVQKFTAALGNITER